MDWTARRILVGFFEPGQRKATLILFYMALALFIWKSVSPIPSIEGLPTEDWGVFLYGSRKIFLAGLIFGLIPALLVKFVFREKLSDYGVQLGNWRRVLFSASIMVPILAVSAYLSGMDESYQSVYPLNPSALWSISGSPVWFVVHSVLYLLFFYFSFEFFFRGFILRGLSDSCGVLNALLIQSAGCVFYHFGHPGIETWASFVGSIFWGYVVLRTNSILSNWMQHATLGIGLDWGILAHLAGRL